MCAQMPILPVGKAVKSERGGAARHVKRIREEGEKSKFELNFAVQLRAWGRLGTYLFPCDSAYGFILRWIGTWLRKRDSFGYHQTPDASTLLSIWGRSFASLTAEQPSFSWELGGNVPLAWCFGYPWKRANPLRLQADRALHRPVPDQVLWWGRQEKASRCDHS